MTMKTLRRDSRGVQVVNIEIQSGEVENDDETEAECECEVEGTCCAECGCCCGGEGEGECGCDCGAGGACAVCGCACDDPTLGGEMNACAPGGKKRRPRSTGRDGFTREIAFRLADTSGDGQTLSGYAAVFDSPTRIDSWEGTFDEQIRRGAFKRYLSQRMPTLMFEHGHHPLIGSMPLGKITRATEDSKGLFIEARLSDNWLIEPVRDAVRDGAVTGMSFRFMVADDGESWEKRKGDVPLRTLTDVDVPELGPVVFPAYEPTTVSVRSSLDRLTQNLPGVLSPERDRRGNRVSRAQDRAATQRYTYDELLAIRNIERM